MKLKLTLTLVSFLILQATISKAQTSLIAGDIAIIGFNFVNPDEVGFVALTDIASGTVIHFTDNGWLNTNAFRTGEGIHTWTASSNISKGTVTIITLSGPLLAESGDQILAYQGNASTPMFIYALNAEGNPGEWQSTASSTNTSALPQGLTNATNAIAFDEVDNGYYAGITSGTQTELLSAISNTANWTTSNSRLDNTNWVASITVTDNPTVSTPTFSIPEGTYHSTQHVSINCATDGASIYYTTDGTEPTTSSNLYSEPLEIFANTSLKAFATKTNLDDSEISSSSYTISINLLINEVDASGSYEFIELYDGGVGNTSLDGLVLVLYNGGDDEAYKDIDLDGFTTNNYGYFVIGTSGGKFVDNTNTTPIQDGADAICLFVGNGADFTSSSTVTTENLIDAIVYDNNDDDDAGLLPLLINGESQINEGGHSQPASIISIGRLSYSANDARKTSTYGHCYPTPGTTNFNYDDAIFWDGTTTDISLPSNWIGGSLPNSDDDVVFESGSSVTVSSNFSCKSLIAESGTSINLTNGLLSISGDISNNGSFTVKSTSTSQTGALKIDGAIAGTVTVERYIENEDNPQDLWHTVSIPVTGQDIATFCTDVNNGISTKNNTYAVTSYHTDDDTWKVKVDDTMYDYFFNGMTASNFEVGKLYLMRRNVDGILTFTGTPVVGDKDITLTSTGNRWNGIANPYLTPISGTLNGGGNCFLSNNSSNLDITSGIYVWDHLNGNYNIYNNTEDYNIPLGQGFIVKAAASANSATFHESIRNNNTATFKSVKAPFEHFYIKAEGDQSTSTSKIAFRNDMTLGLDAGYDAAYLEGTGSVKLYTLPVSGENTALGIQALPSNNNGVIRVPIVLASTANQTVTLKPSIQNEFSLYTPMLLDKNTSIQHPFNSELHSISIQLDKDEINDSQFELILSNTINAEHSVNLNPEHNVDVYYANNQIYVNSSKTGKMQINIYNLSGSLCKSLLCNGSNTIDTKGLGCGHFLVQVTSHSQVQTHKIVIR